MSQHVVFVGGIHGAGKSTLSRHLAGLLSATHVTAGALIRQAKGVEPVTISESSKVVPNVNANQARLLEGLRAYRHRVGGPLILDGHFSLLESNGDVVAVPLSVYHAIAPAAVVLVEISHHTAYERLVRRDGVAPPLATISLLADRERTNAESVCAALGIPFLTAQGDEVPENVAQAIASRLNSKVGGAA